MLSWIDDSRERRVRARDVAEKSSVRVRNVVEQGMAGIPLERNSPHAGLWMDWKARPMRKNDQKANESDR
jgi:hypothetical protein